MSYFDADAREMLEVYLLETRQLLGQLGEVLLEAENKKTFTKEDINTVFRIMHTIKSSSAMMGLKGISSLSHRLEDLFSYYRDHFSMVEQVGQEMFDLLFAASDFLEGEMGRMSGEDYEPAGTGQLEGEVQRWLDNAALESKNAAQADGEGTKGEEGEEKRRNSVAASVPKEFRQKSGTVVHILLEKGCRMENVRAFMLARQIGGLCSVVETFPKDLEKSKESAAYIEKNGVFFRFETEDKEKVIESLKKGLFVAECEVVWEKHTDAGRPAAPENKEAEFLSVRTDRLDRLQDLSAELIIRIGTLESRLNELGLEELKEGSVHQLERLIGDVERTVMEMRLVPVSGLVPKFRRILRDMCRDQGKEAELVVECTDIEADKSVVEYCSDLLIHILRNAMDHGIESVQERMEAGKDRKGTITFKAEVTIGELLLSISDDGRGIDEKKVLRRAREKDLLVKPEAEYETKDIYELILKPGFTTNVEVTEYSGRGVGLDVVKSILEDVGGHLYISSQNGGGSTFTVTVPMSLATVECARFAVDGYCFSVPARQVFGYVDYEALKKEIQTVGGREYIAMENRMVPVVDLRKFYGLEGETPDSSILLYAKGMEKNCCILIDSVFRQKRIVNKPLPPLLGTDFKEKTGICGCSIMGDGTLCAALDIEILAGRYGEGERK